MEKEIKYRLEFLSNGIWWQYKTYAQKGLITTSEGKSAKMQGNGNKIRIIKITKTIEIL